MIPNKAKESDTCTHRNLLAVAAVIALVAGTASAYSFENNSTITIPAKIKNLYNQNSNYAGFAIDSQNFTSNTSGGHNDQGADDFIVPQGEIWTITEVDVSGVYFNGSGPAASENVIFYKDHRGMPGNAVGNGTFINIQGSGGPSFSIKLPGNGLKLKPGHYWLSVIANLGSEPGGEWGWALNGAIENDAAMWRQPNCGWSCCPNWVTLSNCFNSAWQYDFMFKLRGTSRRD